MKNPLDKLATPPRKDTADFVQFTRGYLVELTALAKKSPSAVQILLFLTSRMTRENAVVASYTALEELLGLSRSAIQTAIKHLVKGNWVQIVKVGSANGYLINSKVIWRSHQNKRYGYFNAEIVTTETEQKQTVEELENQPLKHIPNVKMGEDVVFSNEALPPPDQMDVINAPPNLKDIPHLIEKHDQTTGEILPRG